MKQTPFVLQVSRLFQELKTWVLLQVGYLKLLLFTTVEIGSGAAYEVEDKPEMTVVIDNDPSLMNLMPCPWCGGLPCDLSEVTDEDTLKAYTEKGLFPVACLNPNCSVQPSTDNKSWNDRAMPKYSVLKDLKTIFESYSKKNDDVVVIPETYLQQVGMSESYLTSKGIKVIVFPGDVLLKPSLVRTTGYSRF